MYCVISHLIKTIDFSLACSDVHILWQLFDLKKFHQNVNRELKRQYPDRTRLETQCMTSLAFVKNDDDLLNCPCWVLIINIVALDMLKGKLMPSKSSGLGATGWRQRIYPLSKECLCRKLRH